MRTARSPIAWVITCQPRLSSSLTSRFEPSSRESRLARDGRLIGIRLEHRGRVRFDHAVGHELDRAGLEQRIVGDIRAQLIEDVELFVGDVGRGESAWYTRTASISVRRSSS